MLVKPTYFVFFFDFVVALVKIELMSTRKTTVKANPALSSIKSSGIAEQQKQVALPEPANPNADASDGGWTLLKGKRTKANAPVSSVSNSTRRSSQRNGRSQTKKTNVQTGGGNEKSPFTDDEVLAVFGADDVLGPPRLAIKLYKSRVYPGTIFSPLNKQLTSLVDGGKLVSLPELGRF
jgi:hypothetical protein